MKSETVSRLWTSSTGPLLYFIFINFSNSKYVLCKMSCEYLTWNPSSFQRTESQFLPLTPRVFHLTFVFHPLSALELWLPSLWIPLAPLCVSGHLLCPCTRGWLCSFIYTWILVHRWGFINTDRVSECGSVVKLHCGTRGAEKHILLLSHIYLILKFLYRIPVYGFSTI